VLIRPPIVEAVGVEVGIDHGALYIFVAQKMSPALTRVREWEGDHFYFWLAAPQHALDQRRHPAIPLTIKPPTACLIGADGRLPTGPGPSIVSKTENWRLPGFRKPLPECRLFPQWSGGNGGQKCQGSVALGFSYRRSFQPLFSLYDHTAFQCSSTIRCNECSVGRWL
jgi:hypothetical protein